MTIAWQPTCQQAQLRLRAQLLADIRQFFAQRAVLEVETPLLCSTTGTDPQLDFFSARLNAPPHYPALYLQTSPEFAMKRLLAAGSGDIYQICKAFRNGESGRWHNPEFTLLEWYRLGFKLQDLMAEVAALLNMLLTPIFPAIQVKQISYQQLFLNTTGLDPLQFELAAFQHFARQAGFPEAEALCAAQPELWLDFLFSHHVQKQLHGEVIWLVADYPALFSSLARLDDNDARITARFEVFINAVELGNGFYELTDPAEQEARFDQEIVYRQQHGLSPVGKDQHLLAALQAGLPDCSGVAIGVDRLLMLMSQTTQIAEVLAFPLSRV